MLINLIGKIIYFVSKTLNIGSGSTWPGHIALVLDKNYISKAIKSNIKTILIAGTNGKTTTGKILQTILEQEEKRVFQNDAGANLLNGIASSIVLHNSILGTLNYDYAIFEVDENTLPLILDQISPAYLILLNLFRDQLDRYGEVNIVASKWKNALAKLPISTTLILNADDPQIATLGKFAQGKTLYFGLDKKASLSNSNEIQDATHCSICGKKLNFKKVYFSHLGIWQCSNCDNKRPTPNLSSASLYPISGMHNKYNTLAAVLTAKNLRIDDNIIAKGLTNVTPAFGRQEILDFQGKKVRILLSKNPTSLNQSLRTIRDAKGKHLLLVLNDRIPDGRDVSWIWDVDFEHLIESGQHIHTSGDRAWDMSLRLKYAHPTINHVDTHELLNSKLMSDLVSSLSKDEPLYILPTYSAMLDVRKILTGKKIL